MAIIHVVTDDTFEKEVLQSDIPVLVDFYSAGCGPCQGFEMTLNSMVDSYEGRLKFVKVEINKNPKWARVYGIRPTPTTMLFENATPKGTPYVGACSSDTLRIHIRDSFPERRGKM